VQYSRQPAQPFPVSQAAKNCFAVAVMFGMICPCSKLLDSSPVREGPRLALIECEQCSAFWNFTRREPVKSLSSGSRRTRSCANRPSVSRCPYGRLRPGHPRLTVSLLGRGCDEAQTVHATVEETRVEVEKEGEIKRDALRHGDELAGRSDRTSRCPGRGNTRRFARLGLQQSSHPDRGYHNLVCTAAHFLAMGTAALGFGGVGLSSRGK
jgi:hypothetical protein